MLIATYKLNKLINNWAAFSPFIYAQNSLLQWAMDFIIMVNVLVSKSDSYLLDSSMFVVEGSWENGYVYDKDVFYALGIKNIREVGECCLLRTRDITEVIYWYNLLDISLSKVVV